jgi:hypothetical protein
MANVGKNSRWAETWMQIMLTTDNGQKAETCIKIIVYVYLQKQLRWEPNNKKILA